MNYAVSEFKFFSPVPRHLRPFEEARGPLHHLREENGRIIAKICQVEIDLPLEMELQLKRMVGKRVGILRTDADYRIRLLG